MYWNMNWIMLIVYVLPVLKLRWNEAAFVTWKQLCEKTAFVLYLFCLWYYCCVVAALSGLCDISAKWMNVIMEYWWSDGWWENWSTWGKTVPNGTLFPRNLTWMAEGLNQAFSARSWKLNAWGMSRLCITVVSVVQKAGDVFVILWATWRTVTPAVIFQVIQFDIKLESIY